MGRSGGLALTFESSERVASSAEATGNYSRHLPAPSGKRVLLLRFVPRHIARRNAFRPTSSLPARRCPCALPRLRDAPICIAPVQPVHQAFGAYQQQYRSVQPLLRRNLGAVEQGKHNEA